jgi:hypothetical protein
LSIKPLSLSLYLFLSHTHPFCSVDVAQEFIYSELVLKLMLGLFAHWSELRAKKEGWKKGKAGRGREGERERGREGER